MATQFKDCAVDVKREFGADIRRPKDVAFEKAQRIANETGNSVLVYESVIHEGEYGVAFTLPIFGERVGERVYPFS